MKIPVICLLAATAVLADNRWIGGGHTIPIATVKAIKSRPATTATYFRINEMDGEYSKWYTDNSTPGGKAVLATLLTAQASGAPIVFYEGACSPTWKECEVTELLLGSGGAF